MNASSRISLNFFPDACYYIQTEYQKSREGKVQNIKEVFKNKITTRLIKHFDVSNRPVNPDQTDNPNTEGMLEKT